MIPSVCSRGCRCRAGASPQALFVDNTTPQLERSAAITTLHDSTLVTTPLRAAAAIIRTQETLTFKLVRSICMPELVSVMHDSSPGGVKFNTVLGKSN